jgi:hypothetical protein
MFSIGEFARLGTVSVRTLGHYDVIGLLRPPRVDPDTGYADMRHTNWDSLTDYRLTEPGLSLVQAKQFLARIILGNSGTLALLRAQHRPELLRVHGLGDMAAGMTNKPCDLLDRHASVGQQRDKRMPQSRGAQSCRARLSR